MSGWFAASSLIVRIYILIKFHERKNFILRAYALYIVFLFVKSENYIFKREIKHVLFAFIAWWKPQQSLWEFSSRTIVHCRFSLIYSQFLPNICFSFHQAMNRRHWEIFCFTFYVYSIVMTCGKLTLAFPICQHRMLTACHQFPLVPHSHH